MLFAAYLSARMTSSSGGAFFKAGPSGGAAEEDEILPPREPLPHHWWLNTLHLQTGWKSPNAINVTPKKSSGLKRSAIRISKTLAEPGI